MGTLGPLVRKTREHKGIRAADLAFQIGKDPSYVSKLERDILKEIPDPGTLRLLSDALGIAELRLLEAIGYRVTEDLPDALPYDSERATVIALAPTLREPEAFVIRATIQAIVKSREAGQVTEQEDGVVSLA